jgi:LysM repeat protein
MAHEMTYVTQQKDGKVLRQRTKTGKKTGKTGCAKMKYMVVKNGSLWKIAKRFETTSKQLKYNNVVRSDIIRPGKGLLVPAKSGCKTNRPTDTEKVLM